MNKISITNLEKARSNPSQYGKALLNGSLASNSFGGRPKSMKWHDAVMEYHNTGYISKAISKLEHSFSSRKDTQKNRRELEDLIIALDNYVDEYNKKGYIHFDKTINIDKQLTPQIKISGWIWLLNIKPVGGYSGYIISKDVDEINWMLELRFPIIQDYIASTLYGCKINEVDVGVIDYTTGIHYTTSYSQEDIEDALEELNEIGLTISNILDV
ncbi:hypothetical protein [Alistipes sp. ZOR0009]|uniref:hypothetical protein n=1 Tax=Alistipes sp. ZOR0009 TaxID=1339253 RepID=UPI00064571AF|nr:hypothetical protein [Alistipes sp. ZOR0009]